MDKGEKEKRWSKNLLKTHEREISDAI